MKSSKRLIFAHRKTNRDTLWGVGTCKHSLRDRKRHWHFWLCTPSRNARHGQPFSWWRVCATLTTQNTKLTNARLMRKHLIRPVCQNFSRAYIRHFLKSGEMFGMYRRSSHVCTYNNLRYIIREQLTTAPFIYLINNIAIFSRRIYTRYFKTLQDNIKLL